MQEVIRRRSAESFLAKIKDAGRARLRVYIGAAAGVGKTYRMLEEAHELKRQSFDVVLALIEPHGRIEFNVDLYLYLAHPRSRDRI